MLRIASLLVGSVRFLVAAPAGAQELPAQSWASQRAQFGFRADLPYVKELVKRTRTSTPACRSRTTGRRSRTCSCTSSVDLITRRSVFITRYPKPPLVVYRFTKHARRQLKAIRKRGEHPEAVRVAGAKVTLATLERVSKRVNEALSQGRRLDGFYVASAGQDRATESVLLRVVTTRPDAQAHFMAKFGPHVRTEVIGDRVECYLEGQPLGG